MTTICCINVISATVGKLALARAGIITTRRQADLWNTSTTLISEQMLAGDCAIKVPAMYLATRKTGRQVSNDQGHESQAGIALCRS